ncbi:jg11553 [Pararge aegeria aegeria]|uniref:Jg11553 protein n=1 Tax=Pararge aegeria aegeria TaxID=348720 RepID=A0A8S4RQ76_9NEOP|nr:jg11553 [Pararge aegeria aegeria]
MRLWFRKPVRRVSTHRFLVKEAEAGSWTLILHSWRSNKHIYAEMYKKYMSRSGKEREVVTIARLTLFARSSLSRLIDWLAAPLMRGYLAICTYIL